MLEAYNKYRSAAHLWAAMLHGQQHNRQDIWPGSPESLPTFIGYAEGILDLACRIPSLARGRRFAMRRSEAWRFTIPGIKPDALDISPLDDAQLAILNDQEILQP